MKLSLSAPGRLLIQSLAILLGSYGLGILGLALARYPTGASSLWPATGFAVAALFLFGQRFWPLIAIAGAAVNASHGMPLTVMLLTGFGNAVGAVAGARVLRRVLAAPNSFEHQTETVAILGASVAAALPRAIGGMLGHELFVSTPGAIPIDTLLNWATGDALGVLVLVPCLLLFHGKLRPVSWRKLTAVAVLIGAAAQALLGSRAVEVIYLSFPLLLVAAAWGGPDAAKVAGLCLAMVAFINTVRGHGALAVESPGEAYLHLQLFVAAISVTALAIAGFCAAGSLPVAGSALMVGWLLSLGFFHSLRQSTGREDAAQFRAMANDGEQDLRARLDVFTDALHGVVGLHAAQPGFKRAAWHAYVERLGILRRYRGLYSIGSIQVLNDSEVPAFVRARRADGSPDFRVRVRHDGPPAERDGQRYLIEFVTGEKGDRFGVEGLDVNATAERADPARRSRDSAAPVLTGAFPLRSSATAPSGMALTIPVYAEGLPLATVAERRRALRAFAFGTFRIDDYVRESLGTLLAQLDLDIFDGDRVDSVRRLFSSAPSGKSYELVTPVVVAQHPLILAWRRGAGYRPRRSLPAAWVIALGLAMSLLTAMVIENLHSLTRRARALAEQQTARLRASERLLAELIDHLPLAIYCKSMRPGFPVLFWNRLCEQMFGVSRAVAIGRTASEIFPPEQAARYTAADQAAIEARGALVRNQGQTYHSPVFGRIEIETRKCVVEGNDGEPGFILGITEDVTARERNQQILIKAREAALAATRAKSEFLANMSHELRTPLNAVIGLSGLLLAERGLPPESRELARVIRQAGDALLAVINDILDYSKIEAGEMKLENVDWELRELVVGSSEILAKEARAKGLTVDIAIDPALPDLVCSDPTRFRQVLLNLMNNAVKFTTEGRISISVKGASGAEGMLVLRVEVSDTGIGIPVSARDRLFKAFSQVNSSTTRQYGGTGLGLSICQRLVQLMGGEIGFTSEPGSGSTFWFTVPVRRTLPVAPLSPPEPRTPAASGMVLVAEDNPANELVIRAVLEQLGYRVTVVPDGEEVLRALQSSVHFDLILMDCRMPALDGFETARAIRARERVVGGRVPILALTAHGEDVERSCRESGMDGWLSKPIIVEHLEEALREHLRMPVTSAPSESRPEI